MFKTFRSQNSCILYQNLPQRFVLIAIHRPTISASPTGSILRIWSSRQSHIIHPRALHYRHIIQSFHHIHPLQYSTDDHIILVQHRCTDAAFLAREDGEAITAIVSPTDGNDPRHIVSQTASGVFEGGIFSRDEFSAHGSHVDALILDDAPYGGEIVRDSNNILWSEENRETMDRLRQNVN